MDTNALEWKDWIQNTKPLHITLADLKMLKRGESLDLFLMDRNLCHDVWQNGIKVDVRTSAMKFFRNHAYYLRYTPSDDIPTYGKWEWINQAGESSEWGDGKIKMRLLHVEFIPNHWHPLSQTGYLVFDDWDNVGNDQEGWRVQSGAGRGKHVSEFLSTTRVGWQGPMMRISDMNKTPYVYKTR